MTKTKIQIEIASEDALILYFEEEINTANNQVRQVDGVLKQELGSCIIETTPSYASLLVRFDPFIVDHYQIRQRLRNLLDKMSFTESSLGQKVQIPVYYSQESGPDLERIARYANLTVEQVIGLHQSQSYRVFAIGFAPGFAYLGELDESIATPRLATPRERVPPGAVAIADRQTAIYPAASPGGWNIVGLCPLVLFNPEAEPTMPYQVGDEVEFVSIDRQEFLRLGGQL